MPVFVIDTIKPKNGGSFPIVEAIDVFVEGYSSLADAVSHFATLDLIDDLNDLISGKANTSDVNIQVANLQEQIDQIVISSAAEAVVAPEVAQARIDSYGLPHETLKDRIDSDAEYINADLSDISKSVRGNGTSTQISSSGTYGIAKDVDGTITYSPSSVFETKKYSIPAGAKKVRVKTTAYDSSAYYTSEYYVYFSNGLSVTGKYVSTFNSKTEVDVTLMIPEGSDTVWIVSRYKMDSSDEDEMQHTNECYSIEYTGGIESDVAILKPEVSELRDNFMHLDDVVKNSIRIETETGKLIQNATVGSNWLNCLANDASSVYTTAAYEFVSDLVGKTFEITVSEYNTSSTRCFGFCDENNIVSSVFLEKDANWVLNDDGTYTLSIKIETEYFFLSLKTSSVIISTKILDTTIKDAISDIDTAKADIDEINYTLLHLTEEKKVDIDIPVQTGYYVQQAEVGSDWTSELTSDSGSVYTPVAFEFDSGFIGKSLEITVETYASNSTRCIGFCDEDNIVVKSYTEKAIGWIENEDETFTATVPIESAFFFLSLKKSSTLISERISLRLIDTVGTCAYVAPNGNDDNDGLSMATAFETVSKALSEGFDRIMLAGGSYRQKIDLSKANGKSIEIVSFDRTSRPVFYDPDCVLVESATLDDSVYSATIDASIGSGNYWLYQEGVPDASTEITDEERLPLQRGKTYRLDDTRIIKCSSSTLEDAIAEIKSSSTYKWFVYDGTLYFSAPSSPSENNPICASTGKGLFENANRSISVSISGIECKYIALNLKNLANVKATDCKSTNIFGWGAITYDNTLNAQFLRCEASSCRNSTNGDGFNADVTNQGEAFSKHYTATLIDCWSHDNADDGYSDHRRAEATVIGGLYEYNGKGGVTPSYGSHCSCYNVYSRKNYSGFACIGTAQEAEGGKYTQMICFNCVAENNTRGGQRAGFYVEGTGNKMILIGCKAIGNNYSFYVDTPSYAKLIDCSTLGHTSIIGGNPANVTVEATTIVSSNQ